MLIATASFAPAPGFLPVKFAPHDFWLEQTPPRRRGAVASDTKDGAEVFFSSRHFYHLLFSPEPHTWCRAALALIKMTRRAVTILGAASLIALLMPRGIVGTTTEIPAAWQDMLNAQAAVYEAKMEAKLAEQAAQFDSKIAALRERIEQLEGANDRAVRSSMAGVSPLGAAQPVGRRLSGAPTCCRWTPGGTCSSFSRQCTELFE